MGRVTVRFASRRLVNTIDSESFYTKFMDQATDKVIEKKKRITAMEVLLKHTKVVGEDDCWEWMGALDQAGYPTACINGMMWRGGRLSYTLFKGPIPKGLKVLHGCDHKWCVNPKCLSLGTDLDNARDRAERGGPRKPVKKLGFDVAEEIRRKYATDRYTYIDLAKEYQVTTRTINYVLVKEVYKKRK